MRVLRRAEYANASAVLAAEVAASSSRTGYDDWIVWEREGCAQELYLPPMRTHGLIFPVLVGSAVADWVGLGDRLLSPPSDHVLIVPSGRPLYLSNHEPRCTLHIDLSPALLSTSGPPTGIADTALCTRAHFLPIDPLTLALCDALRQGLRGDVRAAASALGNIALVTAWNLLRQCSPEPGGSEAGLRLDSQQIRRIEHHVHQNLSQPVSLKELADLVDMSPGHFCRCFKAACGTSPMKFVTQQRLTRARELVERGSLPFTEVALETGFASSAHFSRAYRKCWGEAPSRTRHKAGGATPQ